MGITITGIYIATTVAYNLVRDPSFVNTNFIMHTMDMVLSNPTSIFLGTTVLTAINCLNANEYRKLKTKTIGTKK